MSSWAIVCDVWYLPPVEQNEVLINYHFVVLIVIGVLSIAPANRHICWSASQLIVSDESGCICLMSDILSVTQDFNPSRSCAALRAADLLGRRTGSSGRNTVWVGTFLGINKNVTNAGSQLTWEGGRAGINKNVTNAGSQLTF